MGRMRRLWGCHSKRSEESAAWGEILRLADADVRAQDDNKCGRSVRDAPTYARLLRSLQGVGDYLGDQFGLDYFAGLVVVVAVAVVAVFRVVY